MKSSEKLKPDIVVAAKISSAATLPRKDQY